VTATLRCPQGHPIPDRRHRVLVGPVTRTDEDGRTRTEHRIVGARAECPTCGASETVTVPAPFVGRRVEVAGTELRAGRLVSRGRG